MCLLIVGSVTTKLSPCVRSDQSAWPRHARTACSAPRSRGHRVMHTFISDGRTHTPPSTPYYCTACKLDFSVAIATCIYLANTSSFIIYFPMGFKPNPCSNLLELFGDIVISSLLFAKDLHVDVMTSSMTSDSQNYRVS